jgi:hypothetical protein
MSRVGLAVLGLMLVCSGCASNQVAQNNSQWLLIMSPGTSDYPWGWSHMPLAQWAPMMLYPSEDSCDKSLRNAQNVVQSPVACVAATDVNLDQRALSSLATSPSIETAGTPTLSRLALRR